jgi:hypothetical protein
MVNRLEHVADRWLLLAEDQEHAADFYTITARQHDANVGIGISSITGTLGPALIIPTESIWIIGFNCDVTTLEINRAAILNHVRYESTFFAFANDAADPPFLAIFETGVVAIDALGQRLWQVSTDIITTFDRVDERLHLQQFDGPALILDVNTGQSSPAA